VPLLAMQILWINLVTDSLPALALGMEPPEPDAMSRKPRPVGEPVIGLRRGAVILTHGLIIAVIGGAAFAVAYRSDPANLGRARTVAFCVLTFSQLFYSLACRSPRGQYPRLGLLSNPHLVGAILIAGSLQLAVTLLPFARPLFKAAPLSPGWWLLIVFASLIPVTLIEIAKWRWKGRAA
jgi:Ca2+-transporting ATPase